MSKRETPSDRWVTPVTFGLVLAVGAWIVMWNVHDLTHKQMLIIAAALLGICVVLGMASRIVERLMGLVLYATIVLAFTVGLPAGFWALVQ